MMPVRTFDRPPGVAKTRNRLLVESGFARGRTVSGTGTSGELFRPGRTGSARGSGTATYADSSGNLPFLSKLYFSRLSAAAEEGDISTFVELYESIDWQKCSGDRFAQAVRLALSIGAYSIAKELISKALRKHTGHGELQKMAGILLPATPKPSEERLNTSWSANRAWLQAHWREHEGQWIALRNGELRGVAESLRDLISVVGDVKDNETLLTFID